ncbi:hypothetical protein ACWEWG_40945 [Streptomyces sp. NPDC003758]
MLIAVRGIGRPLQLIAARGEEQMQLMRGGQLLEPRIRGPFNPQTTLNITTNDTECVFLMLA